MAHLDNERMTDDNKHKLYKQYIWGLKERNNAQGLGRGIERNQLHIQLSELIAFKHNKVTDF